MPLVQEKYRGEKVFDKRTQRGRQRQYYSNNNNNNFIYSLIRNALSAKQFLRTFHYIICSEILFKNDYLNHVTSLETIIIRDIAMRCEIPVYHNVLTTEGPREINRTTTNPSTQQAITIRTQKQNLLGREGGGG